MFQGYRVTVCSREKGLGAWGWGGGGAGALFWGFQGLGLARRDFGHSRELSNQGLGFRVSG